MTSMGVGSRTLLSEASFQGHLGSVTGLLQAGADHLEVDASGRTALHWAIAQHHSEVVKQLLEHHRRVGPACLGFSTPSPTLRSSSLHRKLDRVLPQSSWQPRSTTPLSSSYSWRTLSRLLTLQRDLMVYGLRTPQPLEDYDGSGYLAKYYKLSNSTFPRGSGQEKGIGWMEKRMGFLLHLAIKDDKSQHSNVLRHSRRPSAIARCSMVSSMSVYTQLLLDHGADPTAAIPHGYHTPLSLAVNVRSDELIAVLLEGGAYANANQQFRDESYVDPTFPLRTLRTFLSAGANVNTTSCGLPLLYIVAGEWSAPVFFSELIAWGADATWGYDESESVIERLSIGTHWDPELSYPVPEYAVTSSLNWAWIWTSPSELAFSKRGGFPGNLPRGSASGGHHGIFAFWLLFRQKDDAPVESFMSILRMLDHADAIRPDQATIALFQIIKEYMGDKVEALVEALLDAGADIHHPNGPVRNVGCKPYSEGAFDILSLSAIYGRDGVVSYS
ncbi:ankyrin repeat-containing domain protein [Coprinopsis sp. MPI-PUGE-AT-0042]|nr:ankyrin repeat-containing domain protein [Coprinopsis sp. MPI-PUGE-AT-0042]